MRERITKTIDTKPNFAKWEVLGAVQMYLGQIGHHVERAERLGLLDDPIERYWEIGEMGDLLLDMCDSIATPLSEGSEFWQ